MSMLRNPNAESRMWSMFCSEPVSRLSTQTTSCPWPSRCSQRCDPRKPAPPVTTHVLIGADATARNRARGHHTFVAISAFLTQERFERHHVPYGAAQAGVD